MRDREPGRAVAHHAAAGAESVEERLVAIVRALDGRRVNANGTELWFEPLAAQGVQVRLGSDARTRCYARSANFTISYGGHPSDGASSAFRAVAESIKAIDASPIEGVEGAFHSAAEAVARRFAARPWRSAVTEADGQPPAPPTVCGESPRSRALNVIFLDLCAQIGGRPGDALFPLHWGYWPSRDSPLDIPGYDPQRAFSDELLAHIPEGVERILDVGCGLGFNTKLLSAMNKRVTALSPVPHHCAVIEEAKLPGVDVRCARFEELSPDEPYDLLLFSESVNHFSLADEFLEHCKRFLVESGFLLLADDLTAECARIIETQRLFRIVRTVDITEHVAPTTAWWARQMPLVAGYHKAMMSVLELHDASLAERVREIIAGLDSSELKQLFSGQGAPPAAKGRYMINLLQAD